MKNSTKAKAKRKEPSSLKPADLWLTVQQLQNYLPHRPTLGTIYKLTHYRKIPFYKPAGGKTILFLQSEIDRWMRGEVIEQRKEAANG